MLTLTRFAFLVLSLVFAGSAELWSRSHETIPDWIPRGPVKHVREYLLQENGETTRELLQELTFSGSRIKEIVRYRPNPENPTVQRFSHDEAGRVLSWIARDSTGETLWAYRYQYTDDGRLQQETEFDRHGRISGHRAFLYHDDNGSLRVEESAYDATGGVLWWMLSVRSPEGENEQWSMYYPDGRVITEGVRRFDPRDRLIHEEEIDRSSGDRTVTSYYYDQGESPIRTERADGNGQLLRTEEFTYDRQGNITEHRTTSVQEARRRTQRYRYVYDAYGNWIRRTSWYVHTSDGRLQSVEKRVHLRDFLYEQE